MTTAKDCPEPTVEEARKIVEEADAAQGLANRTDPSSGIVMKPYSADKGVLVYDPNDVEIDKEAQKKAAGARKAEDKA